MSEPLVVIGNGMAAARFADELSKRALGRYAVAVVGEEPRLAYNRVLLSSVLAGEVAAAWIEAYGMLSRHMIGEAYGRFEAAEYFAAQFLRTISRCTIISHVRGRSAAFRPFRGPVASPP